MRRCPIQSLESTPIIVVKTERLFVRAALMVVVGRSLSTLSWMYIVSDMSHAGFKSINFGWGEAIYGGLAKGRSLAWQTTSPGPRMARASRASSCPNFYTFVQNIPFNNLKNELTKTEIESYITHLVHIHRYIALEFLLFFRLFNFKIDCPQNLFSNANLLITLAWWTLPHHPKIYNESVSIILPHQSNWRVESRNQSGHAKKNSDCKLVLRALIFKIFNFK